MQLIGPFVGRQRPRSSQKYHLARILPFQLRQGFPELAIEREWKLTRIRNQIKISNWNVAPRYPSARAQKHRSGRR